MNEYTKERKSEGKKQSNQSSKEQTNERIREGVSGIKDLLCRKDFGCVVPCKQEEAI